MTREDCLEHASLWDGMAIWAKSMGYAALYTRSEIWDIQVTSFERAAEQYRKLAESKDA